MSIWVAQLVFGSHARSCSCFSCSLFSGVRVCARHLVVYRRTGCPYAHAGHFRQTSLTDDMMDGAKAMFQAQNGAMKKAAGAVIALLPAGFKQRVAQLIPTSQKKQDEKSAWKEMLKAENKKRKEAATQRREMQKQRRSTVATASTTNEIQAALAKRRKQGLLKRRLMNVKKRWNDRAKGVKKAVKAPLGPSKKQIRELQEAKVVIIQVR